MATDRRRLGINGYHPSGPCATCGQQVPRLSLDHVTPISEGGLHDLSNIQWLCRPCHQVKSNAERRRWMALHGQTEEYRAKIREAMRTPRVQAILAAARANRPPVSAETRAKISAVQRGTKRSEETKARMSASRAAFWASKTPEEKQAIFEKTAAKNRGRKAGPMPDERRQKIGESQRQKWASGERHLSGTRDERGRWAPSESTES